MASYSFTNINCTLVGPGGAITLGNGAGAAKEGITVTLTEEKGTLYVGADGAPMHSLHAGNAGRAVIRLEKTSPTNALLAAMFNFQKTSAANWGQNTLLVSDVYRGDIISMTSSAFVKLPNLSYGEDAGTIEWEFVCGNVDFLLGAGVPDVNV